VPKPRRPASRKRGDSAPTIAKLEAEIERLKRPPEPATVESLLPQLRAMMRRHVATIERLAEHDPLRARATVREALETDLIVWRPAEHGRHVIADFGLPL
jgi:hypothetical protein